MLRITSSQAILLVSLSLAFPMVAFAQVPGPTIPGANDLQLLQEQDRQIRMLTLLALIPVVIAFSFITFVFHRRKREAYFKQTQAELKLSKAEVEIKALKAQINPHFIFNCMNSIHHYMHKNDIKKAGDYLIKFSQLIRMVLENSSLKTITLKEELHALELYIQLEQLRLDHKFNYQIVLDKDLNQEVCEVPAFLIQPFVENAIWHELTKIVEEGNLKINIRCHLNGIRCDIDSEGTGMSHTTVTNALTQGIKKTSLGLNLIRERIELLNYMNEDKAYFTVEDVSQPERNRYGHHVELYIPCLETES